MKAGPVESRMLPALSTPRLAVTHACGRAAARVCAHAHAHSSAQPLQIHQPTSAGSDSSRKLLLSLERSGSRSSNSGAEAGLRATGAFAAEVFPDLPAFTTWGSMLRKMTALGQSPSAPSGTPEPAPLDASTDVQPGVQKVMTVAANLRSMQDIERRMRSVTSSAEGADGSGQSTTGRPADALLLVSGSHPVRTLPGTKRLLPSSLETLEAARRLRSKGSIPLSTQLWAVANPNVEPDASLAEQKVARGASLFLTQPPFDSDHFSLWVEDARKRGLWETARLVVGHPMISSAGNLAFWMSLSSCLGRPACQQLLQQFSAAEASDKQQVEQLCTKFNEQIVLQALREGDASGFHVMPITAKAKSMALDALQPGGYLSEPCLRQEQGASEERDV